MKASFSLLTMKLSVMGRMVVAVSRMLAVSL
jgi:hypothetical protein